MVARLLRGAVPAVLLLLVLALFARPMPAGAQEQSNRHTVQPGETLYRIATTYGLTVDQLAQVNNIVNPSYIYAGQVLVIPGGAPSNEQTGESGSEEAAQPMATHVVQAGETLTSIALRYGVTVQALVQHNNLANPNRIFPGQSLAVPAAGVDSGPAATPAPAADPAAARRIVVDKSEQKAYVYENGQLLWQFIISTGMPGSETWEGTFHVRSKIINAYAYNWGLQMPYWLGFYHTGYLENGFHALPIQPNGSILWEGYLGTPVSYGCVILSYPDAEKLYNWATIGTEVIVQP